MNKRIPGAEVMDEPIVVGFAEKKLLVMGESIKIPQKDFVPKRIVDSVLGAVSPEKKAEIEKMSVKDMTEMIVSLIKTGKYEKSP